LSRSVALSEALRHLSYSRWTSDSPRFAVHLVQTASYPPLVAAVAAARTVGYSGALTWKQIRMNDTLCPSSPPKEGALVIGAIIGDETAYIRPAIPVTENDLAQAGGELEQRFRFSLPCLHDRCKNFAEGSCSLIKSFIAEATNDTSPLHGKTQSGIRHLPKCAIRAKCQWIRTASAAACQVCPVTRPPNFYRAPLSIPVTGPDPVSDT